MGNFRKWPTNQPNQLLSTDSSAHLVGLCWCCSPFSKVFPPYQCQHVRCAVSMSHFLQSYPVHPGINGIASPIVGGSVSPIFVGEYERICSECGYSMGSKLLNPNKFLHCLDRKNYPFCVPKCYPKSLTPISVCCKIKRMSEGFKRYNYSEWSSHYYWE